MKLKRKLEIVEKAVASISGHDDEDSTVVLAALDRCNAIVEAAKAEVAEKVEKGKADIDA